MIMLPCRYIAYTFSVSIPCSSCVSLKADGSFAVVYVFVPNECALIVFAGDDFETACHMICTCIVVSAVIKTFLLCVF